MAVDIASLTGATVIGIILIAVVGNGMTLFVITRYDPYPLRDVTGMFLANLAVADLLQSIFGMPLIATSAFREEWIFGDALCIISGMTTSLFCITSVLTLTAISVDRYVAIVHPFEYQRWLTIKRARLVLVYIWLQALFAAILPVFGWSRYVYLPFEFICTVQWEHDKAYTIFVWCICFVGPLIVTMACYSRVMRVASHQAREKPPTMIGRFSDKSGQVPDAGEAAMADGKNPKYGKENLAFQNNGDMVESSISEITVTKCTEDDKSDCISLSRDVIDQTKDAVPRGILGGKSKAAVSFSPSGKFGMCQRNCAVGSSYPDTSITTEKSEESCKNCSNSDACPSTTNGMPLAGRSASVVILPPYLKDSETAVKCVKSREHSAKGGVGFSGKIGKSRVSPAVAETNYRGKELSSSSILPGYLARVRERIAERRIGDRQHRRKEMKVALILLVVNGTFVLCWFPHFVGVLCLTFAGGPCPFPDTFFIVTTTLAMLNSGCNPFIYTLTYRKFRKAIFRVLPCFRRTESRNMNAI